MKIRYYQNDGKLKNICELSNESLKGIAGMLCKVILKNKSIKIGYADPFKFNGDKSEYDGNVRDYIYLWTFKNLDEDKKKYNPDDGIEIQKIIIEDIEDVYAILYSNPRWGGSITNKFYIEELISNDD